MLLQTNSYIVPKDKRSEHARLLRKFRQTLARIGCTDFEVYEQVGANWAAGEATGRFVQIMRFRDRKHQQDVQAAERQDRVAQQLIQEFCALINFPYQQQQGLFAIGFYANSAGSTTPTTPTRTPPRPAGSNVPVAPPPPLANSASAEVAPPEAEGASILDFGALATGTPSEAAPMRIAGDDAVVESSMAPPDESVASAVEDSSNGEHTGSFSDSPEAMLERVDQPDADSEISDADREAILGELVDEQDESRRQKTDG